MAEMKDATKPAVAYHVVDGPVDFPYAVDAQSAVGRFPNEWSFEPWSAADTAAARKDAGEPEIVPTPEEQAAIDEHAAAVAEANERLKARREKLAAERAEAEQIAADEALVASPPPRPDPTARRPLSPAKAKREEFLKLTPEEQAAKDARDKADDDAAAKKAADAKLVQDKADADKIAAAGTAK